jgi:hypothetical protein
MAELAAGSASDTGGLLAALTDRPSRSTSQAPRYLAGTECDLLGAEAYVLSQGPDLLVLIVLRRHDSREWSAGSS